MGRKSTTLRVWLWISIAAAVMGAFMLYPIGTTGANATFVIIKVGMVASLATLLAGRRRGFACWAAFSAGAVVMTVVKWVGTGAVQPIFVLAIITDVLMPTVAWRLMRRTG